MRKNHPTESDKIRQSLEGLRGEAEAELKKRDSRIQDLVAIIARLVGLST